MLRILLLFNIFAGLIAVAHAQSDWLNAHILSSGEEAGPYDNNVGPSNLVAQSPSLVSLAAPEYSTSPEIIALARGLMNDPLLIYKYVKDNFKYEHYYGSKKGALLTLLEKSGNDYDQCSLLSALLQASGYSTLYVKGLQGVPYTDALAWLGLNSNAFPGMTWAQVWPTRFTSEPYTSTGWSDTLKKQIAAMFAFSSNRGWPSGTNTALSTGQQIILERVWVAVQVGGQSYILDPSYKAQTTAAAFNFESLMGYDRTALLTSAGGTTAGAYSISAINEAGMGTYLAARTSELVASIKASSTPHLSVDEFLGRRSIIPDNATTLPTASPLVSYSAPTTSATIPDNMRVQLSLQFTPSSGPSVSLPISDLGGKRLSLSYSGTTASIYLDDDVILSTTVSGSTVQIESKLTYPNNYASHPLTATYKVGNSTAYALIYGFTPNGQHLRSRQKALDGYLRAARSLNGVTFDSNGNLVISTISDPALKRRVLAETLNVLGLTWIYHARLAQTVMGDLSDVSDIDSHVFGRVGQEQKPDGSDGGFYIDVGQSFSLVFSRDGRVDPATKVFRAGAFFSSAFEHAVIEQLQSESGATSTIKILQLVNRSTDSLKDELFLANASTVSTVRPLLATRGYDNGIGGFLEQMEAAVNAGYTYLIPENPSNTLNQWSGTGFIRASLSSTGMMITGGLAGGYSSYNRPVDTYVHTSITTTPNFFTSDLSFSGNYDPSPSFNSFTNYGLDPVDMGSGAFTLDVTDLTLGESEPRGLSLRRSYNSHRSDANPVGLGWGWTHGYDMRASVRSAPESMLGESTTFDAATTVVAAYACADVLASASSPKDWAVSALISGWAVDQMKNNAVAITLGSDSLQFIKQPDGTYQPPAKSTLTLAKESSTGDYLLTERLGSTYRFAATESFRAKTIKDFDGKELTLNYTSGRLTTVVDAFSRQLTFNYTGSRLSSVNDNGTPQRTITYLDADSSGFLTGCTDAENKTWNYAYTNRRITETKDPQNRIIVQNDYDDEGRVIKQRSQGLAVREFTLYWSGYRNTEKTPIQSPLTYGQTTTYLYDKRNRPVGKIDGEGNRSSIAYDGQDQMVRSTSPRSNSTTLIYDKNFNLKEVQDALGAKTKHYYDSLYRRTKTEQIDPQYPDPAVPDGDAVDRSTTFEYGATNSTPRPDAVVDARSVRTEFTYKPSSHAAAGKPATITVISTDGNYTTTLEYDAKGLPESTKTPKRGGGTEDTTFVYDARGDLYSRTDARNFTTTYTYNKRRQLLTSTGPGDVPDYTTAVSRIFYDDSGNQSLRVDPSGRAVQIATSASGKTTEIKSGLYNENPSAPGLASGDIITASTNVYDNRDWLDYTDGPLAGQRTDYTLDDAGRTERMADALSRSIDTTFNADGQQSATSQQLDASNTRTTGQLYDARGNPTVTTDGRGSTATTVINAWGERLSLQNRLSRTYKFTYYANGLPKDIITPLTKTTTRDYNGRNLLKSVKEPSQETTTFGYDAANRVQTSTDNVGTITYTYNENGQPLTVVQGSETITRTYDPYGRVKTYTDARSNVVQYAYYPSGLLKTITYPGSPERKVTYVYDAHNRLRTVTDWDNRTTTFTYRADGLLKTLDRPNASKRELFYDLAGQLEKIEERSPSGVLHTFFRMGYDLGGRMNWRYRLPKALDPTNEPLAVMTFDNDNRLATWGGQSVVHDDDGNMTSGPLPSGIIGTYIFNARNQLTGAGGVTYTYDAEGNRVSLVSGGQTTRYVLDVNGGTLPRVLTRERPAGGNVLSVYGGSTLLYDYEVNSGSVTYYHYDQIGSTVALSNTSGTVIDRIAYTPYGTIYQRSGFSDTPFLYVGALGVMRDTNGLLFMRARYYNPRTARFINQDPIGFGGGLNWFVYANGDPLALVDPSGFEPQSGFSGDFWLNFGDAAMDAGDRLVNGFTGAGTGALTGATTGGLVGGGVGALAGGVGAGPGAIAGAGAGAITGGVSGFVSGVLAPIESTPSDIIHTTAINGYMSGALSGVPAGLGPPPFSYTPTGPEAARAALGKGPLANPGAPLTPEMRAALQANLDAAHRQLALANQGVNQVGKTVAAETAARAARTATERIKEIEQVLKSNTQAAKR